MLSSARMRSFIIVVLNAEVILRVGKDQSLDKDYIESMFLTVVKTACFFALCLSYCLYFCIKSLLIIRNIILSIAS